MFKAWQRHIYVDILPMLFLIPITHSLPGAGRMALSCTWMRPSRFNLWLYWGYHGIIMDTLYGNIWYYILLMGYIIITMGYYISNINDARILEYSGHVVGVEAGMHCKKKTFSVKAAKSQTVWYPKKRTFPPWGHAFNFPLFLRMHRNIKLTTWGPPVMFVGF